MGNIRVSFNQKLKSVLMPGQVMLCYDEKSSQKLCRVYKIALDYNPLIKNLIFGTLILYVRGCSTVSLPTRGGTVPGWMKVSYFGGRKYS